jgi:carbonic anhydrase
MKPYLKSLFVISIVLLVHAHTIKINKSASDEPSSHSSQSYPVSKFPPLDMTEKDWPSQCKFGALQSPINFPKVVVSQVPKFKGEVMQILRSEYKPIDGKDFVNHNNKKWGMYLTGAGSLYVKKNGITYKYDLSNIHLHIKSEHTFDGKQGDMEIHIVHLKDAAWLKAQGVFSDPDQKNEALVLGTLWKVQGNKPNSFIKQLNLGTGKHVKGLNLNPWASTSQPFWNYEGSLTTPDCKEFVNWIVFDGFFYMSEAQFKTVKSQVMAVYPKGNARNIKSFNKRKLFYVTPKSKNVVAFQ